MDFKYEVNKGKFVDVEKAQRTKGNYIDIEVNDEQAEVIIAIERRDASALRKKRLHAQKYGKVVSIEKLQGETDEDCEKKQWEPTDDNADPFGDVEREDEAEEVRQAVASLNARQRELVRLYFYEKKTQVEIAAIFGVERSCIVKQLQTIYGKLKKLLEKNF